MLKYKTLFDDLVNIIEKSLQIAGLSDIYRKSSKRSKIFMLWQRIIYGLGTFQMPFLMIGEVILINSILSAGGTITTENFLKVVEVSPCLVVCSFCLIKSSRLVIQRDNIIRVLEEFREMWPCDEEMDEKTRRIVDRHMLSAKWITIIYSVVTHVVSTVYNLFPVGVMIYNVYMKGETEFLLPYLVWYPYDNSKNFLIWLTSYTSQFYAGIFATGSVAGADSLFTLLTSHLSMHIELLSQQIKKIPEGDCFETPRERLKNAICQHNKLIRIRNTLEEIYSPIMLFNLVASSVLICILLFSITIAPPTLIVKYGVFICYALIQILMMSWHGSRIIAMSNKLGFAAYSCPWPTLTGPDAMHVKKSLIMLMARAKHPMCITAYGFTVISMKTFSTILRASWSYFTLLRALYQKM